MECARWWGIICRKFEVHVGTFNAAADGRKRNLNAIREKQIAASVAGRVHNYARNTPGWLTQYAVGVVADRADDAEKARVFLLPGQGRVAVEVHKADHLSFVYAHATYRLAQDASKSADTETKVLAQRIMTASVPRHVVYGDPASESDETELHCSCMTLEQEGMPCMGLLGVLLDAYPETRFREGDVAQHFHKNPPNVDPTAHFYFPGNFDAYSLGKIAREVIDTNAARRSLAVEVSGTGEVGANAEVADVEFDDEDDGPATPPLKKLRAEPAVAGHPSSPDQEYLVNQMRRDAFFFAGREAESDELFGTFRDKYLAFSNHLHEWLAQVPTRNETKSKRGWDIRDEFNKR